MLPTIPPEIDPVWYYICVGGAILITGIAKAGFGGGIGILALPLMAAVMPANHMLGIMLPVLIAADALSSLHYLREWDWKRLIWLIVGALFGVLVGSVILWSLEQRSEEFLATILALIVGSICLIVILMQFYRLTGKELPTLPPHPASGTTIGFIGGAVSTISHSAGPIITIYLLQEKLPKRLLVGTMLMYTLIINSVKVPPFVMLDVINEQTLRDSIWFIPLMPVGTLLGAWMNKRVPEKPFMIIMYVAAAAAAGHMVYKVLV